MRFPPAIPHPRGYTSTRDILSYLVITRELAHYDYLRYVLLSYRLALPQVLLALKFRSACHFGALCLTASLLVPRSFCALL